MKLYLSLIFLVLYNDYCIECVQPYFPGQIVFSPNNGQMIYGIDEVNQQAFTIMKYGATGVENGFAMKQFPYSTPDSPQAKYYVQLILDSAPLGCMYGTYWKYGGNSYNLFPSHWVNGTSFTIGNYFSFKYEMIPSTNASRDEDYWFAKQTCEVDGGQVYPCQEIFFKKGTDIPLRSTQVVRRGWAVFKEITNYQIISMGKPDEKYFQSIPRNWSRACRDVNLGLLYYPQTSKIDVQQSSQVQIWLTTPPHRINGSDTVTVQWKSMNCEDCLSWTPSELSFNGRNFNEKQTLTITRVKAGEKTTLQPIFTGGGFDLVLPQLYPIYVE
ncbi:unnamed protein product [Adineta ricciae]|uniref:Uncharacterized protein n=1 Tax=Adineta ricciae TaxID=249248 RepID=A0A814IPD3_ADIRI|nr:unnamed protein product [Adineta ricciae]CAF1026238.1 unnamed protein product [Adineta ricciae]